MDTLKNNDQDGTPLEVVERDVLGLEKKKGENATAKAKPNRIFIGFTVVVILALIYWWFTR
jgi:hypothetical protein